MLNVSSCVGYLYKVHNIHILMPNEMHIILFALTFTLCKLVAPETKCSMLDHCYLSKLFYPPAPATISHPVNLGYLGYICQYNKTVVPVTN